MKIIKNQTGRVRWGTLLPLVIILVLVASFAYARGRVGYGMTGMGGVDIQQSSAYTNALIIRDTSGTAMVTITNAGVVTWAAAHTFSAGVTFDSTTTWGAAGTINFDGTTIDLDPTSTFDLEMAAAQVASIDVSDNLDAAFTIMEATTQYFEIDTQTGSEVINVGNTGDDPNVNLLGTGTLDIDMTLDFDGAVIDLDPSSTFDLEMAAGQVASIDMSDNLTSAFSVMEAAVPYIVVSTNTGTEAITLGGTADDPTLSFAGTGQVTSSGNIDATAGLDVSVAPLSMTGTNIDFDPTGTYNLAMDNNQTVTIVLDDGLAAAMSIGDGTDNHVNIDTSTTPNNIALGNTNDNNSFSFLGTGTATFSGAATVTGTTTANGTFDANGVCTIGDDGDTVAIDSSAWDISATGVVSGIGDITAVTGLTGGWDLTIAQPATEIASEAIDILGGTGGDGTSTTAGAGGPLTFIGGPGGATFTGQDGAAGGAVTITGGLGIALDGGGTNDGAGGDVSITGGAAAGTGGTAVGGNVILNGGALGATIGMVKVGSPTLAITPAVNAFGVAGAVEFDSTLNVDGNATLAEDVDLGGAADDLLSCAGTWDSDFNIAAAIAGGWDVSMAQAADEVSSVDMDFTGGDGGDGVSTTAGNGGGITWTGGDGGATFTGQVGADGGSLTGTGGAGIARDGGGANDGDGGHITWQAGAAGGTNGTAIGGVVRMIGGANGAVVGHVAVGTPTWGLTPDVNSLGVQSQLEVDGAFRCDGATIALGDAGTDVVTVTAEVEFNGVIKWDNIAAKTAAYAPAAATTDGILLVSGAAGAWTYAYPEEDCDAAADVGRIITVKCNTAGATGCAARNVTITPETATIDGAANVVLNVDYESVDLLCGAVNALSLL